MNASDTLKHLLKNILELGHDVPSRVGNTKELTFWTFEVTDPLDRYITTPGRHVSVPAQIAETMWVLAGRSDVEWLSTYLPQAAKFADDGKHWRAGYGPRLRNWSGVDQVQEVIRLLKKDPNTRRAVMSLWDPSSDYQNSLDIPCNNWLHFLHRDGKLNLVVAIRSNDVMWGWSGINFFEWSVLLEIIAHHVGLEVGSMKFIVSSLHLYERHFEKAKRIVEADSIIDNERHQPYLYRSSDLDKDIRLWFDIEAGIRAGKSLRTIEAMRHNPLFYSWLWAIAYYWGHEEAAADALGWAGPIMTALDLSPKRKPELSGLIKRMQELHTEKSAAYGDSWKKRGELFSIIPNIARKVDRILAGTETSDETKLDTAMDLVIYLAKYETWLNFGDAAGVEVENQAIARIVDRFSKDLCLDQLGSSFENLLKVVEYSTTAQTRQDRHRSIIAQLSGVIAQAVGYLVTVYREEGKRGS